MNVNIRHCARCGGDHDGLEFRSFDLPAGKFTHWAPCPTNGEPVLMTVKGASLEEQIVFTILTDLRKCGPISKEIIADAARNGPISQAIRSRL